MAKAMANKLGQTPLELDIEDSDSRSRAIEKLLREHAELPDRIEFYSRQAKGEGILIEPRVTSKAPDEDDIEVRWHLETDMPTERQAELYDTVKRYTPDALGRALVERLTVGRSRYATVERLKNHLGGVVANDRDDDELLQMAHVMLVEAMKEPPVEMTTTERLASAREPIIKRAKQMLATLTEQRKAVDYALGQVHKRSPYFHHLLILRYVEGRELDDVQTILGTERQGREAPVPLSRKEWLDDRKDALAEFGKWIAITFVD